MTIEDIEKAISKLSSDELARLSAWFERFEAARFDRRLKADEANGRLRDLAQQAREDHRKGLTRDL